MGFIAKTAFQVLCLGAVNARLEEESVMQSFIRRVRGAEDVDTDFE